MRKLSQRRRAATFHTAGGAVYIAVLGISWTCAVHTTQGHGSQRQRRAGKTTDPGELPSFFALCSCHLRSIREPLKTHLVFFHKFLPAPGLYNFLWTSPTRIHRVSEEKKMYRLCGFTSVLRRVTQDLKVLLKPRTSDRTRIQSHLVWDSNTDKPRVGLESTISGLRGDSNPQSSDCNRTPSLRTSRSSGSLCLGAEGLQREAKWQVRSRFINRLCKEVAGKWGMREGSWPRSRAAKWGSLALGRKAFKSEPEWRESRDTHSRDRTRASQKESSSGRNTLHRQNASRLRRQEARGAGVVSFYGLGNFIG